MVIDVSLAELYVNPTQHFSTSEWKFILAHEYLQIGTMPEDGLLYDESLNGLSAESIYDMIVRDVRKYAKLDTFRGYGKGDMLGKSNSKPGSSSVDLDEFCRNALCQGLEYEELHGRGFIPAGLIEEIRALSMPPIPWDVELANWFQVYFAPLEKHRTYARPSRRQASTPDISHQKILQGVSKSKDEGAQSSNLVSIYLKVHQTFPKMVRFSSSQTGVSKAK